MMNQRAVRKSANPGYVKATRPASEEVPDSAIAEYFVTEFGFARGAIAGLQESELLGAAF